MSGVLAKNWGVYSVPRKESVPQKRFLAREKIRNYSGQKAAKARMSSIFFLLATIVLAGTVYLYEINTIATQGLEMRTLEKKIEKLNQDNQKLRIQEVESRSMYNIEKATENLDLVSSSKVTYVEMNGPMAMK